MRAIITIFEKSLNGSNEPSGPAKPRPGPTFPSVVAAAAIASRAEIGGPWKAASSAMQPGADGEQPDVEEDERRDRAERALVARRRR